MCAMAQLKEQSPLGLAVQDGLLSALPGIVEWNSVTISLLWLPLFILGYFTLRWRVWMFLLTHSFGLLRYVSICHKRH